MDSFKISDNVLKVGIRNLGLIESRHAVFAISYLESHEVRIDSVLADAQLGSFSRLGALSEMAAGASFGENEPPGFGFSVGLGWQRWGRSGPTCCLGTCRSGRPGSSGSSGSGSANSGGGSLGNRNANCRGRSGGCRPGTGGSGVVAASRQAHYSH